MLLNRNSVNRLGIFFFYDADGIVDDYVTTLLDGFKPFFSEMTIVVNGKLTNEGRAKFLRYVDDDRLIVRENTGFDVWAYKTALDSYGWKKLETFDEVCLFNHTIMGPVYPFSEMFEAMDQRDLDFWGITKYHQVAKDPFGDSPYGYLPEHIQSHFHAYRKSLVQSKDFQDYWDHLPQIRTYNDSVGLHESLFTKRFADKGFKWDTYVNTDEMEKLTYGPIMFFTPKLVAEKRCPIFKRRSFFHHYDDQLIQTMGNNVLDLYEFLRDHTDYDTDLIWQNALRTMNLADLMKNLHLNYILPQNIGTAIPQNKRIALVMHLYYMNTIDHSLSYISSMPKGCDVILTVASEEKAQIVREHCAKMQLSYNIDIRVVKNQGRDVSALLIGVGADLLKYDYVCFIHDMKFTQLTPLNIDGGTHSKGFDNTIPTKEYVQNVIQFFESNPRLGIAMPTPPNHAGYFPAYTFGWIDDAEGTKNLLEKTLGMDVLPIDEDKEVIAPLDGAAWVRPEALRQIINHKWSYDDFPKERLDADDTINHYIVRSYAYIAQANGYFPAYILSDRFARMEITNLAFEQRELVRAIDKPWLGLDIEQTKKNIKKYKHIPYELCRRVIALIKTCIKHIPVLGPYIVQKRKEMREQQESQVDEE
ncbi:rhamnan synthesis F family protein [Bifidobacterium sp. ESL0790]|uniref:rhamnan synthesis F family protein n=1 Tax=Bifidobacterium sp. ESL0790 TaxID=2983233 RepID=UPI0023F65D16|nr:rhamnan synthesis F family protein [Bifidobacterium sp. ESL0790]WEV72338.1 rhamnan synthesis protein F [Bifidobacterium sp. ESL0790]